MKSISIKRTITCEVEHSQSISVSDADWETMVAKHNGNEVEAGAELQKNHSAAGGHITVKNEIDVSWIDVDVKEMPESKYKGLSKAEIFWSLLLDEAPVTINGRQFTAYSVDTNEFPILDLERSEDDEYRALQVYQFSVEMEDGEENVREILIGDVLDIDTEDGDRWTVGNKFFHFNIGNKSEIAEVL